MLIVRNRRAMLRYCVFTVLLFLSPVNAAADGSLIDTPCSEGTAAAAAEALRASEPGMDPMVAAIYDWTGNGLVDPVDAEAILLSATGKIPDSDTLRKALKDSLIGEQFLDKFSYTGPITGEYGTYFSDRISISVNRIRERIGDRWVVYYLADIYLRDLKDLRTAVSDRTRSGTDPVYEMAREQNAILAMSGDYYRARDRGLAIRNGELLRASLDHNRDVCVLYMDGTMETLLPEAVNLDSIMDRGAWQAWCFGPALLDADGLPKTKFNTNVAKRNPRAVIGYYSPGHYCFLVVDGRQKSYSYGVSMEQLSQLMYDLGCSAAYNLDGGATAVLSTTEDVLNQRKNEDRECSDIVYIVEHEAVFDGVDQE